MLRRIGRGREGDARIENGFTLIEVIVAMFVTLILMTAVLSILVSSLQTITLARQRQAATSLTTQSLEQLRALDYSSVTVDNPVAWPMTAGLMYVSAGTPPIFAPNSVLTGISEPLIVNQYSAKRSTHHVDNVDYVVQTYVTDPTPPAGQQQSYNLTVITSWSSTVSHGQRTVAQRSVLFSPSGCLTSGDHPFSGPCQAAFVARAGQSLGGFTLSPDGDPSADIQGFDGRLLSLALPVLSSGLTMEQTASAKGLIGTAEGRATQATDSVTGGVGGSVSVTSDPSSASPQTQTTATTQSAGEVALSGSLGQLIAHAPSGTGGTTGAAIYADQTLCKDGTTAGFGLTTGPAGALRPCTSSTVNANSSDGYVSLRSPTAAGSVDVVLARLGSAGAGVLRAATANLASPIAGVACYGSTPSITSGSCVHAAAARQVGTTSVFAPDGATNPAAGYVGLWYVDNFTETAVSESGRGARAAAQYTKNGTLHYWTGSSYSTVDLSTYNVAGAATDFVLAPVTLNYPDGLTVTASGSVTVNRPTFAAQGPADCSTTCTESADGSSSVRSIVTFQVTKGADSSTFGMAADLGGLTVNSSFKAAPVA